MVERIRAALQAVLGPPPDGEVWAGDDAAVVGWTGGRLLLATDAAVAGVHADLSLLTPADLGWRALMATVSDIGAMGGRPLHAVVSLSGPPGSDMEAVSAGVAEAAAAAGCAVVGGDVTRAPALVVAVAVTGALDGPGPAVTRAGARAGDALFVTGPLGGSAAGLRALRSRDALGSEAAAERLGQAHRRPMARLAEGVAARAAGARAMIDVSDGLGLDLHRLARASGVGFRLDRVPVAEGATEAEALGGGEDYELVVATADPEGLEAAFSRAGLRRPIALGHCVDDPESTTLAGSPLAPTGYQHDLG